MRVVDSLLIRGRPWAGCGRSSSPAPPDSRARQAVLASWFRRHGTRVAERLPRSHSGRALEPPVPVHGVFDEWKRGGGGGGRNERCTVWASRGCLPLFLAHAPASLVRGKSPIGHRGTSQGPAGRTLVHLLGGHPWGPCGSGAPWPVDTKQGTPGPAGSDGSHPFSCRCDHEFFRWNKPVRVVFVIKGLEQYQCPRTLWNLPLRVSSSRRLPSV